MNTTMKETIRKSGNCWCDVPTKFCQGTECQYCKKLDEEVFEFAPDYFRQDPTAKAEIKDLMACCAVSIDDLIAAYQYARHKAQSQRDEWHEVFEVGLELEGQCFPLKRAAQDYADTQHDLDNLQWAKRKFLAEHGGFIDLKKYRKAWNRKHGRMRSWAKAVDMVGDRYTDAYTLATFLDDISRCKAKASRLTRQLRTLGEQAKGKSDSPLCDLYY